MKTLENNEGVRLAYKVMTQSARIVLNIVATYGRSLLALVCGLFSGRWVLHSLGEYDYGLYGVVGGLTIFITFLNGLMANAVGRFYAYSVGQARCLAVGDGLELCRKWFNVAVLVHTVFPTALFAIGYPVGLWAIRNFLSISTDRIGDCVFVWRFATVSCYINMLSIPYQSMYIAKQYIAELTVYSFVQTVANFIFSYYMACHPGNWLCPYAVFMFVLAVVPQMIIAMRAKLIFHECRYNFRYMFDFRRLRELSGFAVWQLMGTGSATLRGQGLAIIINKAFGPSINASMGVANTVSSQAASLTTSLLGAFSPAITNAFGEGNRAAVLSYSYKACKFGTLSLLVFILPLLLELDEVMRLWLVEPPSYVVFLCSCMLIADAIDRLTMGQMISCNASGRIMLYQLVGGLAIVSVLPLSYFLVKCGLGVESIGIAFVITVGLNSLSRIVFGQILVGLSFWVWLLKCCAPLVIVTICSVAIGLLPRFWLGQGLLRIAVTSMFVEVPFLTLSWFVVFTREEKIGFVEMVRKVLRKAHMLHV